jgi:hypothetical protein
VKKLLTPASHVDKFATRSFVMWITLFQRPATRNTPPAVRLPTNFMSWILLAGALALACGPLASSSDMAASASDSRPRADVSDSANPLVASVTVSVDSSVAILFRVMNPSDTRREVAFDNGQLHELVVLDSTGREVWRWSDGRLFTQPIRRKLLAAAEILAHEARWEPGDLTGRFTVIASLTSSNYPLESRTTFDVP